jgi:hypothetical protein
MRSAIVMALIGANYVFALNFSYTISSGVTCWGPRDPDLSMGICWYKDTLYMGFAVCCGNDERIYKGTTLDGLTHQYWSNIDNCTNGQCWPSASGSACGDHFFSEN